MDYMRISGTEPSSEILSPFFFKVDKLNRSLGQKYSVVRFISHGNPVNETDTPSRVGK